MNWYYTEDDKQAGPVDQAEFDTLVAAGKISADTKVWREGMQEWARYGDLLSGSGNLPPSGSPAAVSVGATAQCAECGHVFPEAEMIAFQNARVCAACKPVFVQKLREGIAPAGVLEYAGFWVRFAAKFVDGILLQIASFGLGMVVGMALRGGPAAPHAAAVGGLLGFLFGMAYTTFFNGRFGATPGKMALKLKIVRPNGEPISYMRALGRHFSEFLSGVILCIGYMMAGWDEEKRALHDRICDTRVIRR